MSQHPSASGRQTRLGLGLMIALALSLTASSTLAADGPLPTSGQELLQPGASSPEDVLSIQQLLSLYAHLYDDFETRTWGQLFTDDATFEIAYPTGGPRSRSIWRGRETIVSNLTPRRASIAASSASVGFWPRERITVPSSLVVMVPSPSLSKRENASLNSAICSSVSWSAIATIKS